MEGPIINKVAESGLLNLDLKDFYSPFLVKGLDLSPFLFEGFMLKEKEFRASLKAFDFSSFKDAYVYCYCSTDAIIPQWAFMLLSSHLLPDAKKVFKGGKDLAYQSAWEDCLSSLNPEEFQDKRLILKGCSEVPEPEIAYTILVNKLQPVVKSLMYGEACSTVPIYKKR